MKLLNAPKKGFIPFTTLRVKMPESFWIYYHGEQPTQYFGPMVEKEMVVHISELKPKQP